MIEEKEVVTARGVPVLPPDHHDGGDEYDDHHPHVLTAVSKFL